MRIGSFLLLPPRKFRKLLDFFAKMYYNEIELNALLYGGGAKTVRENRYEKNK